MNPEHLALAKQELSTLLSKCLIEPTDSPWACKAFYINEHAEQVRGKLKLVINYQDLNHFLTNDKFSLPNKSAFFQHLSNAKVLSKFDLKAGYSYLHLPEILTVLLEPYPNEDHQRARPLLTWTFVNQELGPYRLLQSKL